MLRGEINVSEYMQRAEFLRDWLRRQRRMIGYWVLREWNSTEQESERVELTKRYGDILDGELELQAERYKRQQAYRKALGKARTAPERREAAKLLDVQT